ncbi:hypothetical protein G4W71_17805 [Clostridium botulinum]|uniref:hypothetical protein n=1 Tax=Clostridium botulinum TaxID=1491 RepID=UPI001788C142|nr:hypothetical protein [Clostridium botulinum]MBE1305862.1 hypothetical protein [Clostridium botulinum]
MIANRELYLKVINNGGTGNERYHLGEDVTILMNDDWVVSGVIKQIYETFLTLSSANQYITLEYENMIKIANTEWLAGEDIRDS